jgi:hypothetical protein
MGQVELFLIYSYGGTWEEEWRGLQGLDVTRLFTMVDHDVVESAIRGWSKPLVTALGTQPKGCLMKLPSKTCAHAKTCSMYEAPNCLSTAKKMPWCFEPDGFDSSVRPRVAEIVRMWREGVYVVVVEEPIDAGR